MVVYKDYKTGQFISHDQYVNRVKPSSTKKTETEQESSVESKNNEAKEGETQTREIENSLKIEKGKSQSKEVEESQNKVEESQNKEVNKEMKGKILKRGINERFRRIAYKEKGDEIEVLFEGKDPSILFNYKITYSTNGKLKDILKDQVELVKLWVKTKNQSNKQRKKIKYEDFKANLPKILNWHTQIDPKYEKTRKTLLYLESYFKENNWSLDKNSSELSADWILIDPQHSDDKDTNKNNQIASAKNEDNVNQPLNSEVIKIAVEDEDDKAKKEGASHKVEESKQASVNKEGGDIEQLKPIIASSHVDVEDDKAKKEGAIHEEKENKQAFVNKEGEDIEQLKPIIASSHVEDEDDKAKKEGASHKVEESKQASVNKEGEDIEQLKPIIASSHVDIEGNKVSDEDTEHKKIAVGPMILPAQMKRRVMKSHIKEVGETSEEIIPFTDMQTTTIQIIEASHNFKLSRAVSKSIESINKLIKKFEEGEENLLGKVKRYSEVTTDESKGKYKRQSVLKRDLIRLVEYRIALEIFNVGVENYTRLVDAYSCSFETNSKLKRFKNDD